MQLNNQSDPNFLGNKFLGRKVYEYLLIVRERFL